MRPHPATPSLGGVVDGVEEGSGEGIDIVWLDEPAGVPVAHDLGRSQAVYCNRRHAARHRLHEDLTELLTDGCQGEHVRCRKERRQLMVVVPACEDDALNSEPADRYRWVFALPPSRVAPHEYETSGPSCCRPGARECLDEQRDPL